jgi:NitT/TauT family transport system ATP-binding protein
MTIVIDRVGKTFQPRATESAATLVLDDISFEIGDEEIVTVIGPSGSGKSTLLNCIAGLEGYDGSITLDGADIRRPHPAIAVVFQSPHLLPWRTTLANVEYGLEVAGRPKSERREIAREMIALVGLEHAADRYPSQLSGGMQQRVNIARALALSPEVLLMDEPFGALDAITKERLQEQLQTIVAERHLSVLFITHDISEAIYLGDRVLTLSAGPGRIRLTRTVSRARPRRLDFKQDPEFLSMYRELWDSLTPTAAEPVAA